MIPAAFQAPFAPARSAPVAMTVLSRRSGLAELPVQVFAAVVAERSGPNGRPSWTVVQPTQILDYLDASRG